jgi:hypothetical protein
MKRLLIVLLAVAVLGPVAAFAADTADEKREYPAFYGSAYFHALFVSQENFTAGSGVFGDSLRPALGDFNTDIETEAFKQTVESRFRLFLTSAVTEQITGRFALEVNPEYGREQGFGDFRVNNAENGTGELRMKYFFIEVNHDVGGTLGYRIGRQSFQTPNNLVVGDPDAEGATFWYQNDEVGTFGLAAAIVDTREARRIEDVYGNFKYTFPENLHLNGSVYLSSLLFNDRTGGPNNSAPEISRGGGSDIGAWLVGPSDAANASMSTGQLYWAGINLAARPGNFALDFDAVFDFGNIDPGNLIIEQSTPVASDDAEAEPPVSIEPASVIDTVQGSLFLADASYAATSWKIGASGAFASGHDPDPSATRFTAYLDVNADFQFTRFFFDGGPYLVTTNFVSPAVQGSGLIGGKLYASAYPLTGVAINVQAAALAAHYDRPVPEDPTSDVRYDAVAPGAGRYYGTEVDFWVEFMPMDKLHWLAEVDYFRPGNYFAGKETSHGKPADFLEQPDGAWRVAGGFLFY